MPIVSKETEIQQRLNNVYDALQSTREKLREELLLFRSRYENACLDHIKSGFRKEKSWIKESNNHHQKYLEYDIHIYLIDIISDYRDLHGHFPEHTLMLDNIEQLMFAFAEEEKYEEAAVLNRWLKQFELANLLPSKS